MAGVGGAYGKRSDASLPTGHSPRVVLWQEVAPAMHPCPSEAVRAPAVG